MSCLCAGPIHSLIHAASLVESGVYDHVIVVAVVHHQN